MTSKQIREGDFPDKSAKGAKVLVIGSLGHAGVTCVDWVGGSHPNLADFDVVIVNGPSLVPHLIQRDQREFSGGRREESWEGLRWMTSRVAERLGALLASGGTVYAIVPDVAFVKRKDPADIREVETRPWLPLSVHFNEEEGDTVEVLDDAFARYFAHVRRWRYSFKVPPSAAHVEVVSATDQEPDHAIVTRYRPLAVNRQRQPIGLQITASVYRRTDTYLARAVGQQYEGDAYRISGPLVLLPPPSEAPEDEAVRILLEDFCGVTARSVPPRWVAAVATPGDHARKAGVAEATKALQEAERKQEEALQAQAAADEFKRLLYEKGPPLQDIVRKTFETMGVRTVDSPVSDEFMLVWDDEKVLVEVTGTGKSIAQRDLSQLMKDLGNYLAEVGDDVKGVLVGNAWAALPPDERGTPDKPIFPDNVQKTATNRSVALLSTLELFKAYCAFVEDKITPEQVFRCIAEGSGVVTLVD